MNVKSLLYDYEILDFIGDYSIFQSIKKVNDKIFTMKSQEKQTDKELKIRLEKDASNLNSLEEIKSYLINNSFLDIQKLSKNTVLYDGKVDGKILLIGEAPGEEEDLQGVPFCGRSGKLLDNALSSIGISRNENLLITNTVFWRPPANRKPIKSEINLCKPFLLQLIKIVNPKYIILAGSIAAETILEDEKIKISQLRQKILSSKNLPSIKIFTIYHPSYLIRNPIAKKDTWKDLLFIQKIINEK